MMLFSRKKTLIYVLVILIVLTDWMSLFYMRNSVEERVWDDDVFQQGQRQARDLRSAHESFNPLKEDQTTRKNMIIVAHGRSGSSITGDIFNHHPSVFYLHEPLQTVQRIYKKQEKTSGVTYARLMADILRNIFRCNFSESVTHDFMYYYHNFNPRSSVALGSPPFCPYNMTDPRWDPKTCPPLTSERLRNVCRNNYEMTVIKILIDRIDEANIKNVLAVCVEPDIDCKVIFLVRDPRAIIASSRSVGFFSDGNSKEGKCGLRQYSRQSCQRTKENLASIQSLSSFWSNRIMIQRYEDFAIEPLKALLKYFEFAGLPEKESVKQWLEKRTHASDNKGIRKECDLKGKYFSLCTIDDAAKAVNRWRLRVPFDDIVIMEQYCKNAMRLMGYKSINGSRQLLSNITIPLFSYNYIYEKWPHGRLP